jgi:hypothetical protein
MRDNTTRKVAEEQLRQSQARLKALNGFAHFLAPAHNLAALHKTSRDFSGMRVSSFCAEMDPA